MNLLGQHIHQSHTLYPAAAGMNLGTGAAPGGSTGVPRAGERRTHGRRPQGRTHMICAMRYRPAGQQGDVPPATTTERVKVPAEAGHRFPMRAVSEHLYGDQIKDAANQQGEDEGKEKRKKTREPATGAGGSKTGPAGTTAGSGPTIQAEGESARKEGASCETRDRPSFSLPESAGRGTVSGRDAAFAGWQ